MKDDDVTKSCSMHVRRKERCIQSLVRKPEGKRAVGRPRHRGEINSKMDFKEIWWDGVNWIHFA